MKETGPSEALPVIESGSDRNEAIDDLDPGPAESETTIGSKSAYYVRSSHQSRLRFGSKRNESTFAEGISYEVRLQAWNCSCAAFAFAAFSGDCDDDHDSQREVAGRLDSGGNDEKIMGKWRMGGLTLDEGVPLCKHLLACVLAERIEGLGAFIENRVVSREEMAGWAAGWGG